MPVPISYEGFKRALLGSQIAVRTIGQGGFAGLYRMENGEVGVRSIIRLKATSAAPTITEVFIPIYISPPPLEPKVIRWYAKVEKQEAPSASGKYTTTLPIGLEDCPGVYNTIAVGHVISSTGSVNFFFKVSVNGSISSSSLDPSVIDPYSIHLWEIRWYTDRSELWVDGSKVASVAKSPSVPMIPFAEVYNDDDTADKEVILQVMAPLFDVIKHIREQEGI